MKIEYIKGTRNVKLLEDVVVKTSLGKIVIEDGFVSDLASIPRIAWFVVAPSDPGIREPALVHDWLYRLPNVRFYQGTKVTRKIADRIFLEELKDEGVPHWKRYPMFLAVRLVGGGPPKCLVKTFSKIPKLKEWKSSWVEA